MMHHMPRTDAYEISLLPGFGVGRGAEACDITGASAKLLAYVALSAGPVERTIVASRLWPCVRDARAAANLRTALWRITQSHSDLLVADRTKLGLGAGVTVDYQARDELARRVLKGEVLSEITSTSADPRRDVRELIESLTGELLNHWYEDWLSSHQERWRQLRLHALDALSLQLTEAKFHAAAVDAATAAVSAEPLRESGYRALIVAHLAEGNVGEAVRTHERYRTLLERELRISPSLQMYELLSQATGTASPAMRAAPQQLSPDDSATVTDTALDTQNSVQWSER